MKKRSLVAALAMLMVSAIVLTSSTYAWFATGTKAQVTGVSATVGNSQGNITISAKENEGFTTSIDYNAFKIDGNYYPDTFSPVSYNPSTQSFIAGSIDQAKDSTDLIFKPAASQNNEYIKMTVYVKATTACTVQCSAIMNTGYGFVYAAIHDASAPTTNYKVFNNTAKSYQPITSLTEGIDVDANSIMTDKDTKTTGGSYDALGTAVTATTSESVELVFTQQDAEAGAVKSVVVYIWAEGNDELCAGNLPSAACATTLNFQMKG